jgi:hypothetical protein
MNPNRSPCSSFRSSDSRAEKSPYFFVRSMVSIMGCVSRRGACPTGPGESRSATWPRPGSCRPAGRPPLSPAERSDRRRSRRTTADEDRPIDREERREIDSPQASRLQGRVRRSSRRGMKSRHLEDPLDVGVVDSPRLGSACGRRRWCLRVRNEASVRGPLPDSGSNGSRDRTRRPRRSIPHGTGNIPAA